MKILVANAPIIFTILQLAESIYLKKTLFSSFLFSFPSSREAQIVAPDAVLLTIIKFTQLMSDKNDYEQFRMQRNLQIHPIGWKTFDPIYHSLKKGSSHSEQDYQVEIHRFNKSGEKL